MAIRIKNGRLTARERKKRQASARHGDVMILDRNRISKKLKSGEMARSRTAMRLDFFVKIDFGINLDARFLCHIVSLRLMEYFRDALLSGVRADGSGPLPSLKGATLERFGGRAGDFGNKSSWMAHNWARTSIIGSSIKAKTSVKPNGGGDTDAQNPKPRSFAIKGWANRKEDPVDVQSVDGPAAEVIRQAMAEWMASSVSDARGQVAVSTGFPMTITSLPSILGT